MTSVAASVVVGVIERDVEVIVLLLVIVLAQGGHAVPMIRLSVPSPPNAISDEHGVMDRTSGAPAVADVSLWFAAYG